MWNSYELSVPSYSLVTPYKNPEWPCFLGQPPDLKKLGLEFITTLRPTKWPPFFADGVYKCVFLNENLRILIHISLIDNNSSSLVQIMAWRRTAPPSGAEQPRHQAPNSPAIRRRTAPPSGAEQPRHQAPNSPAIRRWTAPPSGAEQPRHQAPNSPAIRRRTAPPPGAEQPRHQAPNSPAIRRRTAPPSGAEQPRHQAPNSPAISDESVVKWLISINMAHHLFVLGKQYQALWIRLICENTVCLCQAKDWRPTLDWYKWAV